MSKPIKGTLKTCKVPGCNRTHLCKGFCNVHYIRWRKGQDLNKPVWERKIVCVECGEKIGTGGQGRCREHYRKYLKKIRSEYLIKMLGGKCKSCGKQFPVGVFDFHHINPKAKKFSISLHMVNKSMEALVKEAKKCDLLCANCHRVLHFGDNYA